MTVPVTDNDNSQLGKPGTAQTPKTGETLGVNPDLDQRYCFTLEAAIEQRFASEAPGGFRVDLDYGAKDKTPTVTFVGKSSALAPKAKVHLETARLLSGSDWLFLNALGVAAFDSRFTLALGGKKATAGNRCLVEGRIRGRVDLRNAKNEKAEAIFGDDDDGPSVIRKWKSGLGDKSYVPLIVSVAFDVPLAGFNADQTEVYRECDELGRSLFLGVGKATFNAGKDSPVCAIRLALYKLTADLYESFDPNKWVSAT